MTTKSRRMCQSSKDIISYLPTDAIDNILKCLSLRDAVRTSILSHRWRDKWVNLPCLVFDRDTFKETTSKNHGELLLAIYEVLLQYRGSIVKLVLSVPGLKSCPQIDQVVSFVSKKCGFKELTLHILEGDEPHKLPLSLFSCSELTRLSLQHCLIEPPIRFKGFDRLVSMEISKCSILPDVLSGLISSSSLLEELKVTSPIPIEGHIVISAPNLGRLFLTGQFASIYLKYTPRLYSCVLLLHPGELDSLPVEGKYSNIFQSLHNLPAIKYLDLCYYYVGEMSDNSSTPRKLTTTFNHLIYLSLVEVSFSLFQEISNVLCLIRSSPNLVKMVVHVYDSAAGSNDGLECVICLFREQEWSEVNLNSLRDVEFHNISGKQPELSFIELLLTISPKLETMIVTPDKAVVLKDRLEILTKVTCFRRLSSLAKITYKNE